MQDPRQRREAATEILHGGGLEYLFTFGLKPELDQMRSALLTNENLDESQRRAYIVARRLILEGFSNLYEKAGIHLPKWLETEKQ